MYRSELVPRGMAVVGLIGGTLLIASAIPVILGVYEAGSTAQVIATIPEFVWEAFLGIYLTFKGFRAAGLRKLGFEPDVPASATGTATPLRRWRDARLEGHADRPCPRTEARPLRGSRGRGRVGRLCALGLGLGWCRGFSGRQRLCLERQYY